MSGVETEQRTVGICACNTKECVNCLPNLSKVQLQAYYAAKAAQQTQTLLQYFNWLSSAIVQAETVASGLQDAVRQMCASNTDVSQSFRSGHFSLTLAIVMCLLSVL